MDAGGIRLVYLLVSVVNSGHHFLLRSHFRLLGSDGGEPTLYRHAEVHSGL